MTIESIYDEYPDNALALLSTMEGPEFTDAQIQRYSICLGMIQPDIGWKIVSQICLERWRPSPREILNLACKRFAPQPDAEMVFAEILYRRNTWKGRKVGLVQENNGYRKARPQEDPVAFLVESAPPVWSHPITLYIVDMLGGWEFIQSGEAAYQGAFKKQVETAHNKVSEKWNATVLIELGKIEAERAPAIINAYDPNMLPRNLKTLETGNVRLLLEEAAPVSRAKAALPAPTDQRLYRG